MKQRRSPFLAYRYLVTSFDVQPTLFQLTQKSKEELIFDVFNVIDQSTKTVWKKGSKRFLFYGFQKARDLFILKFAKETKENIFVEGDVDIEIKDIMEAKFIYVILDTKNQIILLQRNVSVFQTVNTPIELICSFMREKMKPFQYAVNIYPLVTEDKFWNYVSKAEEIYEVSFELNAPNMALFGNSTTNALLKEIKKNTNNEKIDITLKNKEGKLKITKKILGDFIKYIQEVGGKYSIKYSKEGLTDTKSSVTDTAMVSIVSKKNEKYSDEEISTIRTKLDSINLLKSRDEN